VSLRVIRHARRNSKPHEEDLAVALRTKTRRDKVRAAASDAVTSVQPAAEAALDKIGAATEQIVSTVASTVGPALEDARDKVKPAVDDAREKALDTYTDTLVPLAQQALVESKVRGRRAAVKLGIADEPKKGHKLRNLLIVLGLAGVAAFVYTKVTGKDADPAWTQSRDSSAVKPAHAASPSATATGPVDGSDTAPTAPLASEETVESPTPTTPDKPLRKKTV
jgi:hypothetical protein